MEEYKGTAVLNDGQELEIFGTIMECANWSDNVIRSHEGKIVIRIMPVEEEKK